MIPTTRITTQQWYSHTAPTLSMYHSQNSSYSFIALLRFEESSISEVLVWQCNIKTIKNPTNIVDLCLSGQEVYFSRERWQVQSLEGRNVKTNFTAYCFAHFLIKIQKILDFFFLLCLSSNIAPWVQAEWSNMCLNLVMQKIKIVNLFCLPEYSIRSDWSLWNNRFAQYFYFAKSHVNNTFYFGVDPIHLCGMSTGLL